jgi:hypothetical protein
MKMKLTKQQEFIVSECWIMAWSASVQRANLYKKGTNHPYKKIVQLKSYIIKYITESLLPFYVKPCSEERHLKNIKLLIAFANKKDPGILGAQKYKYGVAQKLLNLALKYFWCAGITAKPPHCPVDRIVIEKTRFKNKLNWTQIVEEKDYLKVINEIKLLAKAEKLDPEDWELTFYSRRTISNNQLNADSGASAPPPVS